MNQAAMEAAQRFCEVRRDFRQAHEAYIARLRDNPGARPDTSWHELDRGIAEAWSAWEDAMGIERPKLIAFLDPAGGPGDDRVMLATCDEKGQLSLLL